VTYSDFWVNESHFFISRRGVKEEGNQSVG